MSFLRKGNGFDLFSDIFLFSFVFFPEFRISPFSLFFSFLLISFLSLFYSGKLFKGKDFYDLLYLSQQNHIVARI